MLGKSRVVGIVGSLAMGTALLAGCSSSGGGEAEAPVPSASTSAAATTAPAPSSASSVPAAGADEAWLAEVAPQREAVEAWWDEYVGANCFPEDADCYDVFAKGQPLLEDLGEAVRPISMDAPDFVSTFFTSEAVMAARTMESWSYACPDASDCESMATDADAEAAGVLDELKAWPALP